MMYKIWLVGTLKNLIRITWEVMSNEKKAYCRTKQTNMYPMPDLLWMCDGVLCK